MDFNECHLPPDVFTAYSRDSLTSGTLIGKLYYYPRTPVYTIVDPSHGQSETEMTDTQTNETIGPSTQCIHSRYAI